MEEPTSKKGAKKAEAKAKKEAEKARKAAEREAAASSSTSASAEDGAKDNYGDVKTAPAMPAGAFAKLADIGEGDVGKKVKLRGYIQNSRMQGAKMAFIELREVSSWAIQGVVAASQEGTPVSRQMVKWIGGLKLESYVLVEASVQKPLEPVKSCRVSEFELHIEKLYLVAAAPEMLSLGFATAGRAVGSLAEQEEVVEAVEGMLCWEWGDNG